MQDDIQVIRREAKREKKRQLKVTFQSLKNLEVLQAFLVRRIEVCIRERLAHRRNNSFRP